MDVEDYDDTLKMAGSFEEEEEFKSKKEECEEQEYMLGESNEVKIKEENMSEENDEQQQFEPSGSDTLQDMKNGNEVKKEIKEEIKSEENTESAKAKLRPSTEEKIGISSYLSDHTGFFGILKQRYSDFVVNEITMSGELVQLTDMTVIPVPETSSGEVPENLPDQLTPDIIQQIDELVGVPQAPHIALPNASKWGLDSPKKNGEVLISVDDATKEQRTLIHKAVKAKYPSIISYYKEDDDGKKYIIIQNKDCLGSTIPKRSDWPKGKQYTTFILFKENMDTIEAVNAMAKKVGIKPNMFGYAGTKDKRGKTSQMVSAPRVSPERLHEAAKSLPILLGNFKYLPTQQKLGQLQGNKFGIVLREIKADDETIMAAVNNVQSKGFINFFGSQRFGTTAISTHEIGKELLKSNWQKAINLILAPRNNDNPILSECRKVWKATGDAEAASRVLGKDKLTYIEGKLLTGLKEIQKNDLVGALNMIPHNVRMLYLHSYQSFIWNKIVSRRISKYGLQALPGDLIRKRSSDSSKLEANVLEEDTEEESKNENSTQESEESSLDKENQTELERYNLHILTEEEAEDTDISEVLLPLPGHRVEYPRNEIKDWYIELLKGDELSISSFNHKVRSYSLTGSYRRITVQPTDFSCMITYYNDPTLPLILSDMNKMQEESISDNLLTEGTYKAVVLEMTLPSSAYATMALRELLKIDTSSSYQAKLNSKIPNSSEPRFSSKSKARGFRGDLGGDYQEMNWNYRGRGRGRYGNDRDGRYSSQRDGRFGSDKNQRYGGDRDKDRRRGGGFGGNKGFRGGGRGDKRRWQGSFPKNNKRGKFNSYD